MRQVTGNMTSVVKGMDKAMETMNLERVRRSHPPPLFPLPTLFIHLTSLIFAPVRLTHLWLSQSIESTTTDLARDGQVRVSVLGFGRPDVVHGGCDGLDDGRVDAAGPGGFVDAADGGGGKHRAAARSRGQGGARPRPAPTRPSGWRGGREPRRSPTRSPACYLGLPLSAVILPYISLFLFSMWM